MRQIIPRALQRLSKLTADQVRDLVDSMAADIDRLETVLDSLAEGILVCDGGHNLILANKYADRILPLSRRVEETPPVWNVVRNERMAAWLEAVLRSGDRVEEEEFETEVKGTRRLLSISIFPLVKNYQVRGSLIHAEDITEKRKKEARFRQAENLASLTTLAAGVAHEIKNPLGSISIHIQLLQKAFAKNEELYFRSHPEDSPDLNFSGDRGPVGYFSVFHKYIGVINEEIERLNHIVVDFLFAVRPMNINSRKGDINRFIRELMEFLGHELKEAGILSVLELDDTIPHLEFDERLMKQALLNLVQNALAAMKRGGTLTLITEQRDNEVQITVADTGTGIPEENLAKIFEPYFTTKECGSGLGLTLVFKIVREHRGEISVVSQEGEGSRFTISLPASPQKEQRLLPALETIYAPEKIRREVKAEAL